jgi:hypothetical protein
MACSPVLGQVVVYSLWPKPAIVVCIVGKLVWQRVAPFRSELTKCLTLEFLKRELLLLQNMEH